MLKLLFFSLSARRFAVVALCILAFAPGCNVQRDQAAVDHAQSKQVVASSPLLHAPNTVKLAPKTISPIIVDEPGEAAFEVSYKGGVSNSVLPALYIDSKNQPTPVTTVSSASPRNAKMGLVATGIFSLDTASIAFGAAVTGSVRAVANGDSLRLVWIDESGRVVIAQEVVPAAGDTTGAFTFKMPLGAFGQLHRIALVRVPPNGGNIKVEAVESVRVTEPFSWKDYGVISSGDTATKLFPRNAVKLNLALTLDENPLALKSFAAQTDAYAKSRETKLLERQPPMFDEKTIDATKAAIEKNIDHRTGGLSLLSFGDGYEFSNHSLPFDYDMSAATLDMFRDWLHSRYGAMKPLNTQWKTTFVGWDKIVPPTTDDTKAALNSTYSKKLAVLKKNDPDKTLDRRGEEPAFFIAQKELHNPINENVSAWADFRTFNDYAFARVLRECKKFASDKASTTPSGFTNAQPPSAFGGWDYQNLSQSADWMEEHCSIVAREIVRGIAPNINCISASGGQEAASIHRLWDRWMRGDKGCLIIPAVEGAALPMDDLNELTRGVTLLRNEATIHTDPILIYYSPRSIYVHWMFDSEVQGSTWMRRDGRDDAVHGTMNAQLKSWILLLEDLGYSPSFIHPEEAAAGGLHYPETKVVILPKVVALSQNEAKVLRDFVSAGGCVIADGQCGTFDGLGKRRGPLANDPRSVGTMDTDFGIQRKDFQTNERAGEFKGDAAARVSLRGKDNKPVGADSPELRVLEPGISVAGGSAHGSTSGGAKAMISKSSGKGHYIYLNLCLQDYTLLRADKTAAGFKYTGMTEEAYAAKFGAPSGGEALRLAVSDIIDEMVGENALRVLSGAPAVPVRGLKRARFDLGNGAAFYAVMPLADAGGDDAADIKGAPLDATITAEVGDGKPHCWYDMRRGEFLGSSDRVNAKLEPNRPALLAALPYKAEKLSLKIRRLDGARTFKLTAELLVAGPVPGRHVFHVDVFDPAGKPLPHYAANLTAETGIGTHQIMLGLNEPAGTYHVKFRDTVTGMSTEGDLLKDGVEYNALDLDVKK